MENGDGDVARKPVRDYGVADHVRRMQKVCNENCVVNATMGAQMTGADDAGRMREAMIAVIASVDGVDQREAEDLVMAHLISEIVSFACAKARKNGMIFSPDNFGRACRKIAENLMPLYEAVEDVETRGRATDEDLSRIARSFAKPS